MSTTIIASLLVGAVLSLRFKVLILVPTIIAAWGVLTGIGLVWEIAAAWVVLEIVVVTTALEVGYLATLLMEGLMEGLAIRPNWTIFQPMLARPHTLPVGFIQPCLPIKAPKPPTGAAWLHEIKHDGYRLMARRDPVGIRLITRRGNDWTQRYPLVVEAVNHLKVRSCLIDGEVVCAAMTGV
jgi:ATP-dependent DNA ligase